MTLRRAARAIGWSLLNHRAPEWIPSSIEGTSVVFSPHFDDETLGAGAAILRLREQGALVHIVFMTDGSGSHSGMPGDELALLRREEGVRAAAVLGVDDRQVTCLGYPETRLETRRKEAAERVADLLVRMNCNRVIVPSEFEPDIWSTDHRATSEIVFEALRRVNRRCEVVEYLVWFWYHWPWVPIFGTDDARQIFSLSVRNVFGIKTWQAVNASVTVDTLRSRKFKALSEYRTQMTRIRTDCAWPILSDVAQGEFLQVFLGSREWLKTTFWEADSDAAGSA